MAQLGPVGNWLYKGAVQPRSFYQNMSFADALSSENPWSSKYTGYNPNYKGVGPKVGPLNYFGQGIKSLFGKGTTGNIAGGTPGARYLYEKGITALNNPLIRGANVAGLALGAGQLGYGAGNLLMDATGTRDDVAGWGAKFANTELGKSIADKITGYSTPNITDKTGIGSLGSTLGTSGPTVRGRGRGPQGSRGPQGGGGTKRSSGPRNRGRGGPSGARRGPVGRGQVGRGNWR